MNTALSTTLIREDDQQAHIDDDATAQAPIVPITRPQRYNAWDMRTQTLCCGHWWNGNVCLYGNHTLTK